MQSLSQHSRAAGKVCAGEPACYSISVKMGHAPKEILIILWQQ